MLGTNLIVKQPSQECVASKGEEEPQDEFLKLLTTQQEQEQHRESDQLETGEKREKQPK